MHTLYTNQWDTNLPDVKSLSVALISNGKLIWSMFLVSVDIIVEWNSYSPALMYFRKKRGQCLWTTRQEYHWCRPLSPLQIHFPEVFKLTRDRNLRIVSFNIGWQNTKFIFSLQKMMTSKRVLWNGSTEHSCQKYGVTLPRIILWSL